MAQNDSLSRKLTLAQRTEVFDKTAAKVTKQYFDPRFNGTEWPRLAHEAREQIISREDPEQFELGMHDLVRKLGTSHTGFFHQSVRRVPGRLSIGASFRRAETEVGTRWVAQDVHSGGPGHAAGLRPMDVLIAIDGKQMHPPDAPMFPMGVDVAVQIRRGSEDLTLSISIPAPRSRKQPYAEPEAVVSKQLTSDTGYTASIASYRLLPMQVTRRTALAAITAASYSRLKGANDRVQVGFIGYGLIGAQHVFDFRNQPDADLVALSDCYQPRLEQGVAACGPRCKGYADFRAMLDRKDLDAVVVCTPDHWHALMTMMACAAGKDVYVEKPLTLFVREGRWMVDVARRHKRIVQTGTQQRSGLHYAHARQLVRSGYMGPVTGAAMAFHRNIMPGYGAPVDAAAPAGFDYEMWLGPSPARPYNPKRGIYHFRWFWDFSGGQMTNLGAHDLDIVQWITGVKGPTAVSSSGGRFALQASEDNGQTPDTQDALFEYPGFTTTVSLRETSQGRPVPYDLELFGTKGSLSITRAGFEITCDAKRDPSQTIPTFQGHPTGGPRAEAERRETTAKPKDLWCAALKETGSSPDQFARHVRNFLDCIKSRERPVSDVEDSHRVATACHLANISLRTGRKIRWDVETEQITGDTEASAMLERPYRQPWDDVRRGLLA